MEKITLGLTSSQAEERLKKYGENVLSGGKRTNILSVFLGQFRDAMVMVLIAATVISAVMGEVWDCITILVIILLNALLGFIQEYRTERTLEALKKLAAPVANVYRDGILSEIAARNITIGDIVVLEAGSRVPADCKILTSVSLECDESLLTGESFSVRKEKAAVDSSSLNQRGALYMGTTVTKGRCTAEVFAVGKSTQMGKVSVMIDSIEEERTPLQKRLSSLGKIIGISCLVICAVVALAGILRGYELFDMLLVGISLAVAAIPEGLPATVTICLALSVRRMYKRNVLVNKLHSVETAGCTTIICTDKTGTLTQNKMTVTKYYCGDIQPINRIPIGEAEKLLFICGALCNNAVSDATGVKGEPTEAAILNAAINKGADLSGYRRISENPFDSKTRFMEVETADNTGKRIGFMKGSPDVVLGKCTLAYNGGKISAFTAVMKKQAEKALETMTGEALRTLAFAVKKDNGYIFLGFMGLSDPLRPEIRTAVKKCRRAGIGVIMLTGDHKNTALEIAKQAGIYRGGDVVSGAQIDKMSDEELAHALKTTTVFARVSPENKLRLVRSLKASGNNVAMTGDGVNDAPAVKEASTGVAMGVQGTDVTKEAAKLVLLDDNFSSLVSAIEEGRTVYENIRKFVRYMLSCNIGEVLTMFIAMLTGMPVVLVPVQLLLINLVTDGLPAVALGIEPATEGIMNSPPRKSGENFFSGGLLGKIFARGITIAVFTLLSFCLSLTDGVDNARTSALLTLGFSQLFFVFECKDEQRGIFNVHYASNPKLVLAVVVSAAVLLCAVYLPMLNGIFGTVCLTNMVILRCIVLAGGLSVVRGIIKVVGKQSA